MTLRVALVQVASPLAEPVAERRRRVAELVLGIDRADLVVLPELWAVGYFAFDKYASVAETRDGPTVRDAAGWARELGAHVHVGSFVEDRGNQSYRNTAALIDPAGHICHWYSKVHVFGFESVEAELLEAGTTVGISQHPWGAVASTTCYDLRFPGLWTRLTNAGAESVIVPAAWPQARVEHWRLFTTARAVEQQVFVIACNAVGEQAGTRLGGRSRVVDPWGNLVCEAGQEEGVTYCDLEPALVRQVRDDFPALRDRLGDYEVLLLEGGDESHVR